MKVESAEETSFGPLVSRIYSFFSSILPSSRKFYEFIARDLDLHRDHRILDVGCGSGNLIATISKLHPSIRIFGIDPSVDMIRRAKKRVGKLTHSDGISLSEGTCNHVPYEGYFNVIVTSSSYHHWKNQLECLEYLSEKLETGGFIAIYESYSGDKQTRHSSFTHSLSREEAESLNVKDCTRFIEIRDKVISVRFVKG